MRRRIRTWKRAKWRALFPEEGVLLEPNRREHLWMALLRPVDYCRWQHWRFRRWAVQPGDVFYELVTDRYHRIHEVRHDYVLAEPISGEMLWYFERGKLSLNGPGLVRIAECVDRPLPASWMSTDKVLPL